jgi:hypothetical protein
MTLIRAIAADQDHPDPATDHDRPGTPAVSLMTDRPGADAGHNRVTSIAIAGRRPPD